MNPGEMADTIAAAIRHHLKPLRKAKPDVLVNRRFKKFRAMGIFNDR